MQNNTEQKNAGKKRTGAERVTDLASAREYFAGDIFATELTGIEIDEVSESYARVSLRVNDSHRNAEGVVMGAVYFTMGDLAFAAAANFGREITVTTGSQIYFLAPAEGDILYAEAKPIREGRYNCVYEISITDNQGTEAARMTASGSRRA